MAAVAERTDRQRLERLDRRLITLQRSVVDDLQKAIEQAGELDPEYVTRFRDTAERLAYRLNKELPPSLEPAALAEIRDLILRSLQLLSAEDERRPLDLVDGFLVNAEAIRHVVRDALDEHVGDTGDRGELLASLHEWLPGVPQRDLAALAGVSVRQYQRWNDKPGAASRRLVMVARLVGVLRRAWTPAGVFAWFARERPELDGHAPLQVIDDPDYERRLLDAARQGRAQHGS